MITRGEPWGHPSAGSPDLSASGDDAELAVIAREHPGARVRFVPTPECDIARAIGLSVSSPGVTDLPIDALRLDDGTLAMNIAVLGPAPDRLARRHRCRSVVVEVDDHTVFDGEATTVVIANGQFLRGRDVVPRGHPGDARLEIQVYALARGQRAEMRRRLVTGSHVPHPAIRGYQGARARISARRPLPLEVDGRRRGARTELAVTVTPGALTLVV